MALPSIITLACLLATLAPQPGLSLNILGVSLEGGNTNYLEVRAKFSYALNCDYRTPYDDPVREVLWMRFGQPFYKWVATGSPTVLNTAFLGMVDTSPAEDPHNIHFQPPLQYTLAGVYTCYVYTEAASANASYNLKVVDGGSWPIEMTVHVLEKQEDGNATVGDDGATDGAAGGGGGGGGGMNDQNKYEVDNDGEVGDEDAADDDKDEVMFEDEDCTLVWSLSTPAIYPRPNVTCGHYSFDHEDVVQRLPAGLTLHKFPNGSWKASFKNTHIQVSSLPKNHRLGCSIRIPDTSYKEVVRAPDDLMVESLIDSGGCPGLDYLEEQGLVVEVRDATYTCRGDVLPADRSGLALATVSCPEGHSAFYPNQPKREWEGNMDLSCEENDVGWRRYDPENTMGLKDLINPDSFPVCVPGASGASGVSDKMATLSMSISLILGWVLKNA